MYANGVYAGTRCEYKLELSGGRRLVLRGSPGWVERKRVAARQRRSPSGPAQLSVDQLGTLLERAMTTTHLPGTMTRFVAGEAISFGQLSLDLSGITAGAKALTWGDLQGLRACNGYINFMKKGKRLAWKTVAAKSIPNYGVFCSLVREGLARQAATAAGPAASTGPGAPSPCWPVALTSVA
jgi:hypothetical protein